MKYNLYSKNVHKYSYEHAVKVRWWVPPKPGSKGGHLHRSNDHYHFYIPVVLKAVKL